MSSNKYKKTNLINIANKYNIPIKNRQKKIKTKAELYNSLKKYLIKGGNNTPIPQWMTKYQNNNELYDKLNTFFSNDYLTFKPNDTKNFIFNQDDLMKLTKMERYILYLFYTGVFDQEITKFKNKQKKQKNNYKQDKLKDYLIVIYIKTEKNHKKNMSYKMNIKKVSNNIKVLKINSDFINSIHKILNNQSSNISSSLTGSCLNKIRLRIDNVHNLFKEEVICLKEKEDSTFFYKLDIDSINFSEIYKKIFEDIKKLKLGDVFKIDITKEFNIELIDFSLFDKNQNIDTSFVNTKLKNLINIKSHFLDNIKIITQNINFIDLEKTDIRFYLEYFYGVVFNNCINNSFSFITCYLPYSTFLNSQFKSLYFKSCILEYSKFENSKLYKAVFREVILSNLIINKSVFENSFFYTIKSPDNYIFKNSIICKSTFKSNTFDGLLVEYIVNNCKLIENNFLNCEFINIIFVDCNFKKCDFENCQFISCIFKDCILEKCKFIQDNNKLETDLSFNSCIFNNIEFKNINFSNISNFYKIDLKSTKFIGEIIRSKGLFDECENIPDNLNIKIVVNGKVIEKNNLSKINSMNLKIDILKRSSVFFITINLKNINTNKNSCNNNIFSIINRIDKKYLNPKNYINFKINDQTGIDAGGITKIVFDNYYKGILSEYFIYDTNKEFVIIKKKIKNNEFKECLEKLYFLKFLVDKKKYDVFRNESLKIFIPLKDDLINIFSVLSKYCDINSIMKNKANKNEIKNCILNYISNEINLKNNKKYFRKGKFDIRNFKKNMNLSNHMIKINNKTYTFNNLNENSNEDKKIIYFSVFLKTLGFEDFDHFVNNYIWYLQNWNKSFYTNKIDFSEKSFIERIEIEFSTLLFNSYLNLDNFINDFDKLIKSLKLYPNLQLFLRFIKKSDENRQKFNNFITGSKFQISNINIYVDKETNSTQPIKVSTCFNSLTIYNKYEKLTYEQIERIINEEIEIINISY